MVKHVNGMFRIHAINAYKISLPFKLTLACDQHLGLLIVFPNEKYWLFVFPNSTVFDKISTAIRITVDMLNGHVSLP